MLTRISPKGSLQSALAVAALTVAAERALVANDPTCAPVWLWVSALGFAALWLVVLRQLRFDSWLTGILAGASLLYLTYSTYTDPTERNYDGLAHLSYARHVAEHGRLPPVHTGGVYMHPPLYYLLGAGAIRGAQWTGLSNAVGAMQALSLLLSLAFVVVGVLTIQRFTERPLAQWFGAALLAFWPTTVMQSIRIHNDVLISALAAAILYCLARVQQDRRTSHLIWAVVLSAAAVFTKANAYAWVLLLMVVVVARAIQERLALRRVAEAAVAGLVSAASIYLATELRAAKLGSTTCHRAIGAICNTSSEHLVGNSWVNYLYFDLRFFLSQPFLINDPYAKERDYFLNMFLKSSLFSAMPPGPEFHDRLSAALAVFQSWVLLGLLVYLLSGVPERVFRGVAGCWVLAGASAFMLLPLIALRIKVPLSMHGDSRYVFPLLVPFVVYYSKLVEHWRTRARPLLLAGACLAVAMTLASILLFLPNASRLKGHAEPSLATVELPLAAVAEIRPVGSSLRDERLLRFGPRERVALIVPAQPRVSRLDVSLDADDQYEIMIRGRMETRRIVLGPTMRVPGLMRYERDLAPPVDEVHTVHVRAVQSDGYYSLGHLRLE